MINIFQYDKNKLLNYQYLPAPLPSGPTLNSKIMQDLPLPRVNAHASLKDLNVVHPRVMEVNAPGHTWTVHWGNTYTAWLCVSHYSRCFHGWLLRISPPDVWGCNLSLYPPDTFLCEYGSIFMFSYLDLLFASHLYQWSDLPYGQLLGLL